MRPRPGRYARDLRTLCERHTRDLPAVGAAAPTTWALRAQCARDLVSGCAHCAPNLVFVTVHCLGSLFMDTIHEHCSQGKKKVQKKKILIFLGGDLIYEIFILHLL